MKRLAATIDSRTLDVPIAAFAGLAVAFLFWVVPADLLAALTQTSGIASVLPAAAPPLGGTARLALGGLGALLAFAFAFAALRLAERIGAPRPERAVEPAEEPELRVRKRDVHPDAPAPRPIMASRDFGEPAPPRRRPIWQPAESELEAEAEAEAEPIAEAPLVLDVPVEPEPVVVEAEVEPAPPPPKPAEPKVAKAALSADDDLATLMARLEAGLSKRTSSAPVEPVVEAPPLPAPAPRAEAERVPEPVGAPALGNGAVADDRLQSAIASLQRLAARQH